MLSNAPQGAPNDAKMPPMRPRDDQKGHPSQHNTFLVSFWRHQGRPGSAKMTLKSRKKRSKISMQNCLRQNSTFHRFLLISVPQIVFKSTFFSIVRFRGNHCFCLVKPMFFTICHHLKSIQKNIETSMSKITPKHSLGAIGAPKSTRKATRGRPNSLEKNERTKTPKKGAPGTPR